MPLDFTDITPESIAHETEQIISAADALVELVVATDAAIDFGHRLAPLEDAGDVTARGFSRTAFMAYVHPDPGVRDAARHSEERLSKWGVDLAFREDVYRAVKQFSESEAAASLAGEKKRLLDFTMRDLLKAGHGLAPEKKARLQELANRMVELSVEFERNIADDKSHVIAGADELAGLPPAFVESLEERDGGYVITMEYPHVVPILDNAENRELRRRVSAAFNSRAMDANRPALTEAIGIRREIAGIFGVASWAHHKLDEQMAKNPENVDGFYEELIPPLTDAGLRDVAAMRELLTADGHDDVVRSYDWRYYDSVQRRTDYGVDQAEVAAHFPLDSVVEGMLDITGEVFGIRYEPVDTLAWHPDVTAHAIFDADGTEPIAHFYMDLFPREGKFTHAAAFPLVPGRRLPDGSYQKPVSAIVANFTKPTPNRPSLLRHSEVETLFHEFGHILHQTLTTTELVRFAGTSTERDFVEAPSQIMQHWVWKPDVLSRFARHHETGEPIPEELVKQLSAAKLLNVAIAKLRQAVFGRFDLAIHGPAGEGRSEDDILLESTAVGLFPHEEGTFFPASFGHLMGGYDAGYYGYLWSEVYGDDMFSRFEEEGYLDPGVGADYRREVLATGGSRDGFAHLEAFLGRVPNNLAFLRNLGIGPD